MKLKTIKKPIIQFLPLFIALGVLFSMIFSSTKFISKQRGEWENDVRSNLYETLIAKKSILEKSLYSRIYYTKGVAGFVSMHPNVSNQEFQELAKLLIKSDSVIGTMALSKDCVIGSIFPEAGHEEAIGLDLMAHPQRREIVEKTIETQKTFVAGPVELVEGGIAFISYTPIFNKKAINEKFWGVTDIVIKMDKLFEDAKLELRNQEFEFALQGADGTGAKGEIFWGNPEILDNNPVTTEINLPTGEWILAAAPINGWSKYLDQDNTLYNLLILSSIIISILSWLFSRALVKLKRNEKELTAIFNSMHNLIIELSNEGRYLRIAPTNKKLLYKPESELLGKTVFDFFDKDLAELFYQSINASIKQNKLVVIEYPLVINNQDYWFMARISKRSENSVIFNAYDISEKKKSEEQIKKSEKRLKELNSMKDKFFSVIAHDLKNPIGSFMSLSSILNDQYDELDETEKKRMLELLRDTGSETLILLEDLLNWSLSQQNEIKTEIKKHNLNNLCNSSISSLSLLSKDKNIRVNININDDLTIKCDENLTKTIIRNLFSNAVKFTNENGNINFYSNDIKQGDTNYRLLKIEDNGVGMSQETLSGLFSIKKNKSSRGTKNESGTGLGLIICKEFIEKQGGFISVESKINEGSTFTIGFPIK